MSNLGPSFGKIVPYFLQLKDIFTVLGVGRLYEVFERGSQNMHVCVLILIIY